MSPLKSVKINEVSLEERSAALFAPGSPSREETFQRSGEDSWAIGPGRSLCLPLRLALLCPPDPGCPLPSALPHCKSISAGKGPRL